MWRGEFSWKSQNFILHKEGAKGSDNWGRAVLIEVYEAPPTPARAPALASGARAARITFRASLPSDAAPFRIPDHHGGDESCPEKYKIRYDRTANTSQALHLYPSRYLQSGESTQVGAVLDVDVGGAATAAAVGVLGGLRHGGHFRCSSLGRQSALRYRSGTVRLVRTRARSARAPVAVPRPRSRPGPALPATTPASLQAPGGLELADRVTTPAHPPLSLL